MPGPLLAGRRALITQADEFMGPALTAVFQQEGAEVVADRGPLLDPSRPAELIAAAGHLDILVVNLAVAAPSTPAHEIGDDEWRSVFAHLVDPLPRLCRAVLPQMLARRAGRIVVMGSASALRGMRRTATYSAARGAQLAYVQAVGIEVAASGVRINALAQHFVDNPTYFPEVVKSNPRFVERLARDVPAGHLGDPEEDARFAAYLASDGCKFMVGQAIPFCGGWATR